MVGNIARYWIAVASLEHVKIGQFAGFMQVCHGKSSPLKRISKGDTVIYYSPTEFFGKKDKLQSFTAIGMVSDDIIYQVEMSKNFYPWRRNVIWYKTRQAPIQCLLDQLSFTQTEKKWGYKFRFGLFEIPKEDADVIQSAMKIA